jgi:hypothetical protein
MNLRKTLLVLTFAPLIGIFVTTAAAQDGSQLGFVNKLGIDVDLRSGGRILQDELASGPVILPDSESPVGVDRESLTSRAGMCVVMNIIAGRRASQ